MRPERLRRGVALLSQRYEVRVGDGILAADGYLAGDDERRADELNQLLRDPDVRAIFPAKGGYGITRILDRLDPTPLTRDPKLLVGFSDATALLCWAHRAAGVRGVHGPMLASLAERPAAQQMHLFGLLEGKELPSPISCESVLSDESQRGHYEGPLLGGNLVLLSALVGTPYQIDLGEAVLFLEATGKLPSSIDMMLTQLRSAGALDDVRAALLGELTDSGEEAASGEPTGQEVVIERMASFNIPLLTGLPIGHGNNNWALPFGGRVNVDLRSGKLTFLERAVA